MTPADNRAFVRWFWRQKLKEYNKGRKVKVKELPEFFGASCREIEENANAYEAGLKRGRRTT